MKCTIQYIKEPLSFLFNKCSKEGHFPDILKVSKVVPIFKSGDKSLPKNYRPVSVVPIFSKIFESLMHEQLSTYFNSNSLLSASQYGFREGRSTTSAVLEIVNSTIDSFEKKEKVALSLCDLSKAFDCVPFDILLKKLQYYGMTSKSLKFVESYLSNRQQFVSVNGKQSSMLDVSLGVPQGSVLGPFFFIVTINDLSSNVNSKVVIYADDTTLFASNNDMNILLESSQAAQSSACNWFASNGLLCNPDKTQKLIVSLSHDQQFHTVKLLGIHLDSNLDWKTHVNHLCKKLSRASFLIWKLESFVSDVYLRSSYFGLFQSHMAYGLAIWGHSTAVNQVLLIQKKVVRTLCRADPLDHCKPLFLRLRILTVINLYILQVLIYTKQHMNLFELRSNIHTYNTRGNSQLDLPQHRLAKSGNSFKINCVKFFNKLPESANTVPFNRYKSKINDWLINNPFYSLKEFYESSINLDF